MVSTKIIKFCRNVINVLYSVHRGHLNHWVKIIILTLQCSASVMGGSPGELSEELCDVGEAKEGLENEL